ncbi:MAG: hypothetical protein NTZ09_09405, partial [Candidatus Hydrogenedentes bacterium]|nr:hypothetical protein [Candidatus Hydrogenedentota bacterium]
RSRRTMTDFEANLAQRRLAAPPASLRGRVLAAVAARRRRERSEAVLRWAIAALVATLAWAHVQEGRTAERMARAAATASGVTARDEGKEAGLIAHALLYPKMPMPLPQGYPSTRRHVKLLSVELNEWTPGATM